MNLSVHSPNNLSPKRKEERSQNIYTDGFLARDYCLSLLVAIALLISGSIVLQYVSDYFLNDQQSTNFDILITYIYSAFLVLNLAALFFEQRVLAKNSTLMPKVLTTSVFML